MKAKTVLALAALGAVPFIMVLGNSMLIPVLPQMQKQLGISQFQTSLVITLFSVPAGLVIPFAGFLSDRLGRKKVITPALLLYGVGGLIAGFAALFLENSFWTIIGGRIIQGIGAAGTAPVAMALVGDIFTSKERGKALGYIEASNGLGKVVSPVLGSLIAILAWYATFFVFPFLTIPAALAVWFLVREPKAGPSQQQGLSQYFGSILNIFRHKAGFMSAAFLAGALSLLLLFGILFFLSDYLETSLNLFGVNKGLVLAIPVLVMSSASLSTGIVIKKRVALMKILVITGLGIIALSLGILPFSRNPWLDVIIMSVTGLGVGLILPCLNTLITSSASIQERGMITSLYGGIRFFGVAAGPPIFGLLVPLGRFIMFWSGAGAALLLGLICMLALPSQNPEKPDTTGGISITSKWGAAFLETISFKNTIGKLVTKKPFPPQDSLEESNNESNSFDEK